MRIWLLLLTFLLQAIFPVYAQTALTQEAELIQDLDLRLRLNSLILEVADQIDAENPSLSLWQDNVKLSEIFEDKAKQFGEFYLKEMSSLAPEQKSLFRQAWSKIRWNNIIELMRKSYVGVKAFFKRKSFGIAIAITLGIVSEYIVPLVVSNLGLHWLLPITPFIPYQVLYSMVPQKIIDLQIRYKVSKSLGGQQQYQAYMHQESALRANIKKMKSNEILIPVNAEEHLSETISLTQNGWFKKLLQRVGLNDQVLTYTTLNRFLEENALQDDYILMIAEHPRMKSWQKASLMITHIYESFDQDKLALFREHFDRHILELKSMAPWEGFEQWIKKMLRTTSVQEVNDLLSEIPERTPTRLILGAWDKIILPMQSSQTHYSYGKYRRLVEDYAAMRAIVLNQGFEEWNMEVHQKFVQYLGHAVGDQKFKDCRNQPQQILRFLIAN